MKSILIDYVIRNKKNFIIIITLFCIGIAIGILFINNSNENQKIELNNYIEELVKNIKESNSVNKIDILCLSIKQNVYFILIIWLLGCTIIRWNIYLYSYNLQRIYNWIYDFCDYSCIRNKKWNDFFHRFFIISKHYFSACFFYNF